MIALLLGLASQLETAGKPKDQVHPGFSSSSRRHDSYLRRHFLPWFFLMRIPMDQRKIIGGLT